MGIGPVLVRGEPVTVAQQQEGILFRAGFEHEMAGDVQHRMGIVQPRPGERVGLSAVYIQQEYGGKTCRFKRVMRAVERTGEKKGCSSCTA